MPLTTSDPINGCSKGWFGGSDTVREGETLASVAMQLWGDPSLGT